MSDSQRSMEEDSADREVSRLNAEGKRYKEHALHLHAENKVLIELLRDCLQVIEIDINESDDDESALAILANKIIEAIESHDKGGA
jgi:hypothetical protein